MEPGAFDLGTRVLIAGLQGRADLNGRHGTVCGVFDEAAGRVPVRVSLAKPGASESVRIKLANLRSGEPERRFQVICTQCTMGNTGFGGSLGTLVCTFLQSRGQANSPLLEKDFSMSELEGLVSEGKLVEHPTELCDRFGLSVLCYAQPYRPSDEHRGINNILATFLTINAESGLAPSTVLGDAVFVRLSPTSREPVDFVWSEAARALCYVNDLMEVYPLEESCPSLDDRGAFFDAIRQCFPFYMANGTQDDNMRESGFFSSDGTRKCRRKSDGSMEKKPAGMQPDAEFVRIT